MKEEARSDSMMTPVDIPSQTQGELGQAEREAESLREMRESLEAKGLTPPLDMLKMELAAIQKTRDLTAAALAQVEKEQEVNHLAQAKVEQSLSEEQERIARTLQAMEARGVKLPTLPAADPVGVHAPQLDRIQIEANILRHLTAAGQEFASLAPSQEALEEFNRRALLLMAAKPSEPNSNGHPALASPVVQVKRKRVFLAMPHTGHVELSTCQAAFWHSNLDQRFAVFIADQCSSLLAYGFNMKWCDAVSDPQGFDYFCLLHSDIYPHLAQPDKSWLAALIDELECNGYDALHAITAIKDVRGLTSTAIGRVDDEWAKVRRITVEELLGLPETWDMTTLQSSLPKMDQGPLVGHRLCLLPNTGVLLVKLGPWVDRFPGFTIKDRLIKYFTKTGAVIPNDVTGRFNRKEYVYRAQVVPEDWGFGRWCAQNGVRVGCTRKVRTDHYGRTAFPSHQKWGQQKNDDYHFNEEVP